MSVLISGMEMPKAGNWKTIRIYYDGTCAEPNWQGDCKYMQGCEAVSVPPHGRLIDADALGKVMSDGIAPSVKDGGFKHPFDIIRAVANAPTIIPAEEDE